MTSKTKKCKFCGEEFAKGKYDCPSRWVTRKYCSQLHAHLDSIRKANEVLDKRNRVQSEESRIKRSIAMKGRKPSPQTIEASRKAKLGKPLSESTKAKLSRSLKGRKVWNTGLKMSDEYREKCSKSHLGVIPSEETRKKRSITMKELWRNGHHQTPEGIRRLSESMKKRRPYMIVPVIDSKPERIIQQKLKNAGVVFTTHKPIIGQPDMFIEPNVCIFVDGCYIHGCGLCGKKPLQLRQIDRDKFVTAELIRQGYRVIRIPSHRLYPRKRI